MKIWSSSEFSPEAIAELEKGLAGHELSISSGDGGRLAAGKSDDDLGDCEVAFGQPDPKKVMNSPQMKWVQLTSAGYTRYDTPEFERSIKERGGILSNASSVFDEPCAQHLLAFMLAEARQLPSAQETQAGSKEWRMRNIRSLVRVLENETVLILSYGAIARRLIELLAPFKLYIFCVRRKVKGDEVVKTFSMDKLKELLPTADHIVDILPSSLSTDGLLDAEHFALVKPAAVFYNVGRGTTVDQNALIDALDENRLKAAYLDVTTPEPLPTDHPLWVTPRCHITPHVAGGRQDEDMHLVQMFLENFALYSKGEKPKNVVFG